MNLRSLLTNHSCNVCGKILLGVAYQDWSGNRVCEEHNKCFCSSCGRYYGAKATEIVSGEWLCENCKNNLPDIKTGDYIGFVDSDDYIDEDFYEILLANLEKYDAEVSCCRYTNHLC